MALVPVSIELDSDSPNVHVSEACAMVETQGGSSLLSYMADAAGLTESQYISTIAGVIGSASGMIIARNDGIEIGKEAARNLENVITYADYPDWSDLTTEQQTTFGNRENYNAVKFNEFCRAFGLSDLMDGYYASYTSSGGGTFSPTEYDSNVLNSIGRIGSNWARGLGNSYEDVKNLITNVSALNSQLGITTSYSVSGASAESWPTGFPEPVPVGYGQTLEILGDRASIILQGSEPVYWIVFIRQRDNNGTFYAYEALSCSKTPYTLLNNTTVINAQAWTAANGETFYAYDFSRSPGRENNTFTCNMPYTITMKYPSSGEWSIVAQQILFGDMQETVTIPDDVSQVVDYPDEIPDNTPIYYPDDGINPTTDWQQLTTQPEYVPPGPDDRPQNPYNPNNPDNPQYQSGTPEWQQATTENLQPALNIRFDKLFPFCLIYDLQVFWDKLKGIAGTAQDGELGESARNRYELITIPGIQFPGLQDGITLDLEPIARMLRYVRPAVFWLLVVTVIMSVVKFWQNILTGS